MSEKIRSAIFKLRTYWSKPPQGYDVTYKEFLNFSLGFGAISFLGVLIQWTTLSITVYMMISHFKVSTGLVFFLNTVVGSVLGLIRAPILSMIIDNSNSKKGKFKPFLIWSAVGTAIFYGAIPYIPASLNETVLFNIHIPAIPIMGVMSSSDVTMSVGVLIMFILMQIGVFFNSLLNQAMQGIEQTISTNAQERANIVAFKGLICNIPSSVVNILLPIIAGIFFAESGHQLNIDLYRLVFPFCAIGGIILIIFAYKGTTERVVVSKQHRARVGFIEGAKQLSQNKYFWIILVFNIACGIRALSNITSWVAQFSFFTSAGKTLAGLFNTTLLMNVLVLGMVFAPMLIKKFGKMKVLAASNIGFTLMVLLQLLVYKNPYLILFSALLQNVFSGVQFISTMMVSDVLDYQQYKTGKRLEGFWTNYNAFISTIIGLFTGMLLPLFLSFGGIGFGDDYNEVLQNPALRDNAYKFQTLLALIGSAVASIPIFFYDLTEAKHANIVRVLRLRAAADNYKAGELEDSDVLNAYEIMQYAKERNDIFLLDELQKHDCLDEIIKGYEDVKRKVDLEAAKERKLTLERGAEVERNRIENKVAKAKAAAQKKGQPFDEEAYRAECMSKSFYISQLAVLAADDTPSE
ncbi:MAG TPA: MFS transporter [Clostridia bacterium]|jgi:Na+/melibiose symporter-like transporter|nr:MFS transporter [Clostridia bacterium]HOL61589.1 MFS transporter [Clostridia bacterium]HPO54207.1 MFS transporter [Clostridia bacterium]